MYWIGVVFGLELLGLIIWIYGLMQTWLTRPNRKAAGYDWPERPSQSRSFRRGKVTIGVGVALFVGGVILNLLL